MQDNNDGDERIMVDIEVRVQRNMMIRVRIKAMTVKRMMMKEDAEVIIMKRKKRMEDNRRKE